MPDWRPLIGARVDRAGVEPDRRASVMRELEEHLDEVYAQALRAGLSPELAAARAEQELEGLEPLAGTPAPVRRRLRFGWPVGLSGDLRRAAREVRRRPAYAATVAVTLALGIGGCTTVFSLLNGLLLQPLPYPDPDRLVLIWEADAKNPANQKIVAAPVYEDWRARAQSVNPLGIWEFLTFNLAGGDTPMQVPGIRASASLFAVLGTPPALGRTFTREEDQPGHAVVVLSDAVWRSAFAADPAILGRTVRLDDHPYQVIGVMPPGFAFPRSTDGVYVPIAYTPQDYERGSHSFFVAGRLAPGSTLAQAQDEFRRIGTELAKTYPDNQDETSVVDLMNRFNMADTTAMLRVLVGAVAFVLLIAGVNVANLHVASAFGRQREFATRLALGSGWLRLARQLALEGVVLSALGGLGGLLLAWMGVHAIDALLGHQFLIRWFRGTVHVGLDGRVVLVTVALGAVCALVNLAPLVGFRLRSLQSALRDGARGATSGTWRTRQWLVGLEVALAIVVLSGAGLLGKSLAGLLAVDPGLKAANVMTVEVSLPQASAYGPAERVTLCAQLLESARLAPELASVSSTSHLPLTSANASRGLTIEGINMPAGQRPTANYRVICPGYFATLGIGLLSGREFSTADRPATGLVIVNRVFAKRWFGDGPAVGRRLKIGGPASSAPWLTIVGVSSDVRHFGLGTPPAVEIYVPYGQSSWPVMTLIARTRGAMTRQAAADLREVLRRVDPNLPAADAETMTDVVGESVAWRASYLRLMSVFGLSGLALAAVGIYGALAHFVSQRTREIGVRMALGATRGTVTGLVLRQSILPVALGVGAGLAGAVGTGQLLRTALFEVAPTDPWVNLSVVAVLAGAAFLAGYLPASRAARIDPLVALREI